MTSRTSQQISTSIVRHGSNLFVTVGGSVLLFALVVAYLIPGSVKNAIVQPTPSATTLTGEPSFTDEFKKPLNKGDEVAGFVVTSPFDPERIHPVSGVKRPHNGADFNTSTGTPAYIIGVAGETIEGKCWWDDNGGGWVFTYTTKQLGFKFQYLHLDWCKSGEYTAGDKIGETGNTGTGTGAHFHFEQSLIGKDREPPWTGFAEIALTGKIPDFGLKPALITTGEPKVVTAAGGKGFPTPDPKALPDTRGNYLHNVDGIPLSAWGGQPNGNIYRFPLGTTRSVAGPNKGKTYAELYDESQPVELHTSGKSLRLAKPPTGRSRKGLDSIHPVGAYALLNRGFAAMHGGLDYWMPEGSTVVAIADGTIEKIGWDERGGGNSIAIRHPNGLRSIYKHLKSSTVQVGQKVSKGMPIGTVGSSNLSYAPHLHFELEQVNPNGSKTKLDPAPYLPPVPAGSAFRDAAYVAEMKALDVMAEEAKND